MGTTGTTHGGAARVGALFVATLAFLVAPFAHADLVEPITGMRFESQPVADGTMFQCLGVGVLRSRVSSAYAMTYCIEKKQAELVQDLVRLAFPGSAGTSLTRALVSNQEFFDALAQIPGNKLVVLSLMRKVSKQELGESFREPLSSILPPGKTDKFLAAIPRDGAQGETVLIYSRGARVVIDMGGSAESIDDDAIAARLWSAWLGPKSLSPTLKSSIARGAASSAVETVHRPPSEPRPLR